MSVSVPSRCGVDMVLSRERIRTCVRIVRVALADGSSQESGEYLLVSDQSLFDRYGILTICQVVHKSSQDTAL